jgi:hypothetical protein
MGVAWPTRVDPELLTVLVPAVDRAALVARVADDRQRSGGLRHLDGAAQPRKQGVLGLPDQHVCHPLFLFPVRRLVARQVRALELLPRPVALQRHQVDRVLPGGRVPAVDVVVEHGADAAALDIRVLRDGIAGVRIVRRLDEDLRVGDAQFPDQIFFQAEEDLEARAV